MPQSTVPTASTAMAPADDFQDFLARMLPPLLALFALQQAFRQQPPTPELTHALETASRRRCGRPAVSSSSTSTIASNRPVATTAPCGCVSRARSIGVGPRAPMHIGTLFGEIELRRYLYEAVEAGEPALFPLENHLGIEAGPGDPGPGGACGLVVGGARAGASPQAAAEHAQRVLVGDECTQGDDGVA